MSRKLFGGDVQLGDFCDRGHKIVGKNMHVYTVDGVSYLECAHCSSATPQLGATLSDEERYDGITSLDGIAGSSYAGLKYLKLNKRAQRAWEPLEKAFDRTRSLCHKKPEAYIDYDEEHPPTPAEAYMLCEGCPMLVECGRFANAYKPVIGVWGGEVWENGKVVKK